MKKFTRKDITKKKRISNSGWRKPKGITNKKRLNRKGHSANVRPGYGTPNKEKNKKAGLEIIIITNIQELEQINPKTECIVIGRCGKQKKLNIIKKAEEKKITITNLKVETYKEKTKEYFAQREKTTKTRAEEQKKKEEEAKKDTKSKQKEDKKEETEITDEEKQKQEKAEKDKILTKSK